MRKENGVLYFKENWFLRNVWGVNFWAFIVIIGDERRYPKNLCSLFWGSLFGVFICIWVSLFVAACGWFVIAASTIVAVFCGFYPRKILDFFPYKHIGNRKIPVAAWEICAFLLGLYLVVKYGPIAVYLMANSTVVSVLASIIFIIFFLFFLFKTTPGKVIREYIKAVKRKVCPLVMIEKK